MPIRKVAVLGGGAGGHATAVELTLKGYSVALFEMPQFVDTIADAISRGGIEARGPAIQQGFVEIDRITTDITEALGDADLVLVCLPMFGVELFARHCAPHLRDGQHIAMLMSSALGSVLFRNTVKEVTGGKEVLVAEATSLPFACRRLEANAVNIWLRFHHIPFATFPSREAPESLALIETCQKLFPSLLRVRHVLEVALNNGNPITHPAASLLNIGQIEAANGDFFLYAQGISPGVAQVIQAVDRERIAISRAMGLDVVPNAERLVRVGLSKPAGSLYDTYRSSDVLQAVRGPGGIQDRYVTEDIPFGLVLWSSIAQSIGVPTPLIDGLIQIGSALCGRDFRATGLTAKKLGIAGLTAEQLDHFFVTGELSP